MSVIRVLTGDGSVIVREGLSAIIKRHSDMQMVAEAGDGQTTVSLARKYCPDVVLIDLYLPVKSGIEVSTSLTAELPGCRVIILAERKNDEEVYKALRAGASAFLLKSVSKEELIGAVRAVAAGQVVFPTGVSGGMLGGATGSYLTHRELQILRLIFQGKSNKEVGAELGITEGTVKGHVNNILGKLNSCDRTQAVVTALSRGIIHLD